MKKHELQFIDITKSAYAKLTEKQKRCFLLERLNQLNVDKLASLLTIAENDFFENEMD